MKLLDKCLHHRMGVVAKVKEDTHEVGRLANEIASLENGQEHFIGRRMASRCYSHQEFELDIGQSACADGSGVMVTASCRITRV